MVKREMENVQKLDVPLIVDVGIGDNWRDAK
jgi:DNA polymerase-1